MGDPAVDPVVFVPFAEELADAAGEIARRYFREPALGVDAKADGSPVTRADREAEAAMRDRIARRFPTHGVIGEEHGESNPGAEFRWVLDPIDGTKSYVLGIPMFATLIALLHGADPILGVIDQSVLRHRAIGDNRRATVNGRAVHVRPCDDPREAALLTPDHWSGEAFQPRTAAGFDRLTRAARVYRCIGDGYAYSLLAAGFVDAVVDPVMNLWDLAALLPVVRGAGGVITSWEGGEPLAGRSAVAAGPLLHHKIMATLHAA
ncbi:MAG: inositol monophosphatase family protein [Planctomycetes bacterium]|nr:inositol monophosphatase family protein [Planctomycetota bacterium]